jgi:transcriptional regulator with XRE-family HTH domain
LTDQPITSALGELGAALRALRTSTGKTGTEFAELLGDGWQQSKVSKIERGRQLPSEQDVVAWALATATEPAPLVALRQQAAGNYRSDSERNRRSGGAVAHQRDLSTMMESCRRYCEFQPTVVPGLLQTAAYITSWAEGDASYADLAVSSDEFRQILATRLRRQSLLYEPGREFTYVMTEAALRTRIGRVSATTLRNQLAHLGELAVVPGLTIGIVPFEVALPVGPSGFAMYDATLVRIETSGGVLELTDDEAVARYSRWLDQLVDVALTGEQAAEFCRKVAASIDD